MRTRVTFLLLRAGMTDVRDCKVRIVKRYIRGCFAEDSDKLSEILAHALASPVTWHVPCSILITLDELNGCGTIGVIELLRGIPVPGELVHSCHLKLHASSANWAETLTELSEPEVLQPYLTFVSGKWQPPLPPAVERAAAISRRHYVDIKVKLIYVDAHLVASVFERLPSADGIQYITEHEVVRETEYPIIE